MTIKIISFAYSNGTPAGVDTVTDCRTLRNPHGVPEFRILDGKHEAVQAYVKNDPNYKQIMAQTVARLFDGMTIGLGCFGGKHRSVAVAEALATGLRGMGWDVELIHRDLPLQ